MPTRSPRNSQKSSPPRSESCRARSLFFPSRSAQYGISVQCAEPVTGSSLTPKPGAKKRETKSTSRPRRRDDYLSARQVSRANRNLGWIASTSSRRFINRHPIARFENSLRLPTEAGQQVVRRFRALAGARRKIEFQNRICFSRDHQRTAFRMKFDALFAPFVFGKQYKRRRQRGVAAQIDFHFRRKPPQAEWR